nr:sialidase family protein [Streptomyces poonensis]
MPGRSRTVAAIVAAGLLTALTVTVKADADASARGCPPSVPYEAGRSGYASYRIPAVVRTEAGTVLAFAEGRRDGAGDTGNIDVVLRRSTDGGCTWGPQRVVTAGEGDTRGNPAPVVDPRTGRIVLVTSYNSGEVTEAEIMRGEVTSEQGRRVFVQMSRDDGRSFSAPREITNSVGHGNWRWYATGPGHGVALTSESLYGRLVIPANHSDPPPAGSTDTGEEAKYYGAHALHSDDGGLTWDLGFVDDSYDGTDNSNESSAAELPDGRLYFSARDQNGTGEGNRLDAYSSDGGETLDRPYTVQPTLNDVPVVQGSTVQMQDGPLLFSGPSVPTERRSMAVWRSDDGGESFTKALTLSSQPAAYSDLVPLGRGHVGVLYETGEKGPYERIVFRRLRVVDL